MSILILDEANRCLNCKKPMCQQGCPIHTPIPKVIRTFLDEGLEAAGQILFDNNPLSVVCSLVCDHEKQCEGNCVLGRKSIPVHFSAIENYISDTYLDQMKIECAPKNGRMIAMIGSGPASISAAILLTKMGYEVTIFEAKDKIGGVLRYGIPNFRLPKDILDRYKKKLQEIGVNIRPNTTIGGALQIDDLLRDGYESIFIGTGVWRPKKLGVKGESLGNVHFAIDFLANPDVYELGQDVVIIGAGNAAMDVARTARRLGVKNVTVYERAPKPNASPKEISYAKIDGVHIITAKDVVEITKDGPVFRDVYYNDAGEITGFSPEPVQVHADSTIVSISQLPKSKLVDNTKGLKATDKGLLQTDDKGETTIPGIFASGDVVNGAKTVVEAVAYSKKVVQAMDAYIRAKHGEAAESAAED